MKGTFARISPKNYEDDCKFRKWHSWVMVLLILTKYILLNYIINRIGKKVSKNTGKKLNKKTRQSSKTYISDFKHECGKMFLMKFC